LTATRGEPNIEAVAPSSLRALPARMPEDKDRRQQQRAPIELKVEYKRMNTFFADYTKNISKGGTFIKTKRPLEVGTQFVFKLIVPALAAPLALQGEVRWIVQEGQPPPLGIAADHEPGMGIRFIYESDERRHTIERAVEKMMVDSLGQLIYSHLLPGEPNPGGRN